MQLSEMKGQEFRNVLYLIFFVFLQGCSSNADTIATLSNGGVVLLQKGADSKWELKIDNKDFVSITSSQLVVLSVTYQKIQ